MSNLEPVVGTFSHPDDATGTDGKAGVAGVTDRLDTVLVPAGGHDFLVVFFAAVDVVVICVQAGGGEAFGLVGGKHTEGGADFHIQAVHGPY